jgi:hypothetical protein
VSWVEAKRGIGVGVGILRVAFGRRGLCGGLSWDIWEKCVPVDNWQCLACGLRVSIDFTGGAFEGPAIKKLQSIMSELGGSALIPQLSYLSVMQLLILNDIREMQNLSYYTYIVNLGKAIFYRQVAYFT